MQLGQKHRSLIYFKVCPDTEDVCKPDQNHQTQDTSDAQEILELASSQKFSSFEQMYNGVTEKLVARVLETEKDRKGEQTEQEFETAQKKSPQAFLLIGENDTNLVKPSSLSKPEILSNSSMNIVKSETLHDRLYKEGIDKKKRLNGLQSQIKSARIMEEKKACTF